MQRKITKREEEDKKKKNFSATYEDICLKEKIEPIPLFLEVSLHSVLKFDLQYLSELQQKALIKTLSRCSEKLKTLEITNKFVCGDLKKYIIDGGFGIDEKYLIIELQKKKKKMEGSINHIDLNILKLIERNIGSEILVKLVLRGINFSSTVNGGETLMLPKILSQSKESLRVFELSYAHFGDQKMKDVCVFLKECSSLRILRLMGNDFSDSALVVAITLLKVKNSSDASLKWLHSLRSSSKTNNNIEFNERKFDETEEDEKGLREIDLSDNFATWKTVSKIIKVLKSTPNPTLTSLFIRNNFLVSNNEMVSSLELLDSHLASSKSSLKIVDLSDNPFFNGDDELSGKSYLSLSKWTLDWSASILKYHKIVSDPSISSRSLFNSFILFLKDPNNISVVQKNLFLLQKIHFELSRILNVNEKSGKVSNQLCELLKRVQIIQSQTADLNKNIN